MIFIRQKSLSVEHFYQASTTLGLDLEPKKISEEREPSTFGLKRFHLKRIGKAVTWQ